MTPRPTTTAPAGPHPQPTLTKHELSSNQANYLVRKADMEEFLQETFGPGMDFKVSKRNLDNEADAKGHTHQTKSGRWIYYAERKLTTQEIRFVPTFPRFAFVPESPVGGRSCPSFYVLPQRTDRISLTDALFVVVYDGSKWIAELHKRKKAQLAEARARAGGETESSTASGCGGAG